MERDLKERFKGMALAATLATVGCNPCVVHGSETIKGFTSDLTKIAVMLVVAKGMNDNLDIAERVALRSALIKDEEPKALKDKKLSAESDKDLIDSLKLGGIPEPADLSLFELFKKTEKSEELSPKLKSRVKQKILGLMRKDRFIDLRIKND